MFKIKKKILVIAALLCFPLQVLAFSNKVVLGGQNVGITIQSDGILVVGFYKINGTLNNSKLSVGDYITKVDDNEVDNIN